MSTVMFWKLFFWSERQDGAYKCVIMIIISYSTLPSSKESGYIMFKNISGKIWLITIAHAVTDLSQGGLLVALPYFKAKFGLSYAEVTAIALMQNLTSSIIQPFFGYWSDRNPRPWLIPAGCIVSGLAMIASIITTSYYLLLLTTSITGLGIAAFHPEAAKFANNLSKTAKGKGVSIFVVGGNAGFAAGSILLGLLLSNGDLMIGLYLVPYLLVAPMLINLISSAQSTVFSKSAAPSNLSALLAWPLLALFGVVFARAAVSSGVGTFLPLYYVSFLGGSNIYASWLLSVYLAAGAIGTLAGGIWSDRFGSKTVMLWSILPVSALLFLLRFTEGPTVFFLLSIISALLSCGFSSALVLAQQLLPGNVGVASGIAIGFSVGLGAISTVILGKIADFHTLPVVFDILAFLPIIAFVLTFFIHDTKKAEVTLKQV